MRIRMLFVSVLLLSVVSCETEPLPSSYSTRTSSSTNTSVHEHTFSDTWSYNETYHWHDATCGHNVISDKSEHTFSIWQVEKEATPISEGIESRSCIICDYKETRPIEMVTYSVMFDLKGGTSSQIINQTVSSFDEIQFWFDCVKSNYIFRGWALNGELVYDEKENLQFKPMMKEKMTFVAQYSNTLHLTIQSSHPLHGKFTGEGDYPLNSSVHLSVEIDNRLRFKGWAWTLKGPFISYDFSIDITVGNKDITVYALYEGHGDKASSEEGIIPSIDYENNRVLYGLYPYAYLEYNGDLHRKIERYGTNVSENIKLYNGSYYYKIISQRTYENGGIYRGYPLWFTFSPIRWKILEKNGNEFLLASEDRLDAHVFHGSYERRTIDDKTIYPNDYMYSDIRNYLNNDFYNFAFMFNDEYLFKDENNDKIRLLTEDDFYNSNYGMTSPEARNSSQTGWTRYLLNHFYEDDGQCLISTQCDEEKSAYTYNQYYKKIWKVTLNALTGFRVCIKIKI